MKLRRLQMGADYVEDEKQNSLPGCIGELQCDPMYLVCDCRVRRMCEELCADLYPGGDSGSSEAAVRI